MAMHDLLTLTRACAVGTGLGVVFFGGLWWTIRHGISARQPALWFFGSLLLRMAITLAGFYVVAGAHWEQLAACLLGFVTARLGVTWLTRPTGDGDARPAQEVCSAPQP
jgi:F1F0 ATPase subunit 2